MEFVVGRTEGDAELKHLLQHVHVIIAGAAADPRQSAQRSLRTLTPPGGGVIKLQIACGIWPENLFPWRVKLADRS